MASVSFGYPFRISGYSRDTEGIRKPYGRYTEAPLLTAFHSDSCCPPPGFAHPLATQPSALPKTSIWKARWNQCAEAMLRFQPRILQPFEDSKIGGVTFSPFNPLIMSSLIFCPQLRTGKHPANPQSAT